MTNNDLHNTALLWVNKKLRERKKVDRNKKLRKERFR